MTTLLAQHFGDIIRTNILTVKFKTMKFPSYTCNIEIEIAMFALHYFIEIMSNTILFRFLLVFLNMFQNVFKN